MVDVSVTRVEAIWSFVRQCDRVLVPYAGGGDLSDTIGTLDAVEGALLLFARKEGMELPVRRALASKRALACRLWRAPAKVTLPYCEALARLGFQDLESQAMEAGGIATYFLDAGNPAYALDWLRPVIDAGEAYARLPAPARQMIEARFLEAHRPSASVPWVRVAAALSPEGAPTEVEALGTLLHHLGLLLPPRDVDAWEEAFLALANRDPDLEGEVRRAFASTAPGGEGGRGGER